jgi:transposase
MSKDFRAWKIDEAQLLPPSVQDYVPKDHLSRLIVSLVRESLDLSAIIARYRSGLGQPPFDPRMMTALLLHGYSSGIYSSRRIAKAAVERADFMMIVAGDPPDFRTISEFRKRHLKALAALFVQVLKLAEKAGLVKLGHVALDGTKIKANASKHKAMSYERMKRREAELQAEIDRWLEAAEAADAEEDRRYGDKRGDELPDWVADKEKRLVDDVIPTVDKKSFASNQLRCIEWPPPARRSRGSQTAPPGGTALRVRRPRAPQCSALARRSSRPWQAACASYGLAGLRAVPRDRAPATRCEIPAGPHAAERGPDGQAGWSRRAPRRP